MGYDPLARRRLGSAPLDVTCLGLGCGPLGGFRHAIPEDEALGIVRTAYDAGARLFDTSPLYGYGRSELRLGQVLRQLPRESFVVSTKVGRWLTPRRPDRSFEGLRGGGLEFVLTYDLSYDGVMRAIGVAFVGVLIILRPGLGAVHPMALLALLCSAMFALYQILTRIVSRTDPPLTTLFYTALVGVAGLTSLIPFYWKTPDAAGWGLFLLVAALGASGHFLLIKALQLAPASLLQPFSYTILIWATLVGFVVFGNLPDLLTVAGAIVITLSGIYTFARERRLRATRD